MPRPTLATAALGLCLGLCGITAHAHEPDARVWVSFGDVVFSAGHPYHRHSHAPLRVEYIGHSPRYYLPGPPRMPPSGMPAGRYPAPHHYGPHPTFGPIHRDHPPHWEPAQPPPPRPGYPRHRDGYYR